MNTPFKFRILDPRAFAAGALLALCGSLAAQDTAQKSKELDLKKKEQQIEKKSIELEKKEIDLAKRQLDLERTKKELAAQETAGSITMRLEGDVVFDFDKAEIKPAAEQALQKVAVVVSQFPEGKVLIDGFTDSKGSPKANLALSKARAAAVKKWLVKNGGIPAGQITTGGHGEEQPIAPNKNADGTDNPEGRAQNRRVQVTVEKHRS